MKVGAVIPARISSRRLPGKVLRDLAGAPLIERVLRRARRVRRAAEVVVATSVHHTDDPIVSFCNSAGCPVFRGALDNVATRVRDCAIQRGWTHFARINGDSPFADPVLIDEGLDLLLRYRLDWVTNVLKRTYPYGVAVEAYSLEAFTRAVAEMTDTADLEHVSSYFIRHNTRFSVAAMANPRGDWSSVRLTVDDESDLERMAKLIDTLGLEADRAGTPQVVAAHESLFAATHAA